MEKGLEMAEGAREWCATAKGAWEEDWGHRTSKVPLSGRLRGGRAGPL